MEPSLNIRVLMFWLWWVMSPRAIRDKIFFRFIFYVHVYAYRYTYIMWCRCPWRSEESVGSPRVRGSGELPGMGGRNQTQDPRKRSPCLLLLNHLPSPERQVCYTCQTSALPLSHTPVCFIFPGIGKYFPKGCTAEDLLWCGFGFQRGCVETAQEKKETDKIWGWIGMVVSVPFIEKGIHLLYSEESNNRSIETLIPEIKM